MKTNPRRSAEIRVRKIFIVGALWARCRVDMLPVLQVETRFLPKTAFLLQVVLALFIGIERQRNRKRGAHTDLALNTNLSFMQDDGFLCND